MGKLSFRALALDAAKPLPFYRGKDIHDLKDRVSINRAMPQMPTGMEKEEEFEHHLQLFQHSKCLEEKKKKKKSRLIPVPEAGSNVNYYNHLYKGCFQSRLLNLQDSNSEECTSRKPEQTVNNKRVSATSEALLNTIKNGIPEIPAVQLVRTVGHTTTNRLIPALCTSSPQILPMNNSFLTNAVHLNNASIVSPINVHINTALKLATVAASMDRVPKLTPSSAISSIARENHEPERLGLNGIAETTVAMEVT
ncbi:Enhancer of polycomb-like protein 2 [Sciurus carolinensis]|uniref:Enhancer of polycomb-like protein 2 n=1 Tax=Sciurus carolinensis TaxID=30640 RepID=A0AA41SVX3_SCICA|nr:Enhancer of polycomb-like protein 2 [Sciurus carolinensis]